MTLKTGTINLTTGWHSAFAEFYQGGGGYGFIVQYSGPGVAKTYLTTSQ